MRPHQLRPTSSSLAASAGARLFAGGCFALLAITLWDQCVSVAASRHATNSRDRQDLTKISKAKIVSDPNRLDEVEFVRFSPPHQLDGIAVDARPNEINTTQTVARNKWTCASAMRELDRCSSQLIGLGRQTSGALVYPDSMQELDSVFCPRFKETVACVKNQTNCFKPFERQIVNWVIGSTKKMNYKRCKNEQEKARFLKLKASLVAMVDPMDNCMSHYIGSLDAIAEHYQLVMPSRAEFERLQERGDDIQIQLSCCANRRFKQCVMQSAKLTLKPSEVLKKLRQTNSNSSQRQARKQMLRSMKETMDDLSQTLDEMSLTGPEFICHDVDENFCRSKFDERYTGRAPRHRSIVPAMIKIYANK